MAARVMNSVSLDSTFHLIKLKISLKWITDDRVDELQDWEDHISGCSKSGRHDTGVRIGSGQVSGFDEDNQRVVGDHAQHDERHQTEQHTALVQCVRHPYNQMKSLIDQVPRWDFM